MSERDPSFWDCPATKCPHGKECEAAEMEREFRTEAGRVVAESGQQRWTVRDMLADLNAVFTLEATYGAEFGYEDGWTVRAAWFVDVLRSERRKAERIAEFNRRQERESDGG